MRVGKGREGWADDAAADYARRLGRYGPFDEVLLRPADFRGDVEAVRAEEGARLRALIGPRHRLVVLDERGGDLTSEELARLLVAAADLATQALVFALGGPYGHDPATREGAWRTVRLSAMVLNHRVARVVALEQLYRACTIRDGEPYHH